jgi:hypothetical protein
MRYIEINGRQELMYRRSRPINKARFWITALATPLVSAAIIVGLFWWGGS